MTMHFNDANTWRQMSGLYYNDANTWRTITAAWYNDNGTWRQFYSTAAVVNPIVFTGEPYDSSAAGGGGGASCSQTLTLNTDGTFSVTGSGDAYETDSGNWYSPTTTGIGSSYWVRFTRTAWNSQGSATATTGWLQLSSARSISAAASATFNVVNCAATWTIEIASDSGGTNIVSTTTGVDMTASANDL